MINANMSSNLNIPKRGYFSLHSISAVIRFLTLSDIIMLSGYGLMVPIFSIFIIENIEGGTVAVAGIAAAINLLAKSIFQIPFATIIDRIKGERDDFWAIMLGSLACSVMPLFYLVITTPMELYAVQFFYGVASAVTLPAWYAVFTRHVDKERAGIEWGVYMTLTGLGMAVSGAIGGFFAEKFGFAPLFIVISTTTFIGSLFLLGIYKSMKPGPILKHSH
jgi:MFS family permease